MYLNLNTLCVFICVTLKIFLPYCQIGENSKYEKIYCLPVRIVSVEKMWWQFFFFLVHSLPKTQKETEMYDIIPPEGPRESNRSQKKHLLLSLSEFSSCRPATDKTPCSPFSVPTFVFAISMPSGWPPRCCEQVPYPTSQ